MDAIVSGHHHTAIGPPPMVASGIPVVQSGSRLVSFSTIDLALDAEGRVRSFAVNEEWTLPRPGGPQAILHSWKGAPPTFRGREVEPDARVSAILRSYDAQVKALRETRIGETTVDLRKGGADDLLANLAADALRSGREAACARSSRCRTRAAAHHRDPGGPDLFRSDLRSLSL